MRCVKLLVILFLMTSSSMQAQSTPPFTFTGYGGLFFPSNVHYRETFESTSDIIWGFGGSYPVLPMLLLSSDFGFFKAEAFHNSNLDSSTTLEEKFIHVGLINKKYLGQGLFLRLMGGVSFTSIKYEELGPGAPVQSVEADRKIGYYGGVGVEELVEGAHFSFFADVMYDYRRVQQRALAGDFGGIRLVLGVNMIMF